MEDSIKPNETSSPEKEYHKLHDSWTLWAHLPHDTDWSVKSYKKIMTFSTVEAALVLNETIKQKLLYLEIYGRRLILLSIQKPKQVLTMALIV